MYIAVVASGLLGSLFFYFYQKWLKAKKALLYSPELQKIMLENTDEGILQVQKNGLIKNINSKAYDLLMQKNSLLNKNLDSLQKPNTLLQFSKDLIKECFRTKKIEKMSIPLDETENTLTHMVAVPASKNEAILFIKSSFNPQKSADMRKEFIANASHELRTPVTIIRGFAEVLKEMKEVSEEMYVSILDKILRNCERMENLVKKLLLLADLDNTASFHVKECDLIALVEDCCNNLMQMHPNAHIEQWTNVDEVFVLGDMTLLEVAFSNLLKNAVKYSEKDPHIFVKIDAGINTVEVQITDQGIGIPKEDVSRIFDRFYTVDKAHSRDLGGAGLGLSIVKVILQKIQAKISVDSKLNKGTTFTLTFPRKKRN